jgi:hypothetical protein
MNSQPTREETAGTFIRMLIQHAYDGAIEEIRSILHEGPPGREPAEDVRALHAWFRTLASDDQEMTLRVVREAVDAVLFRTLVFLDGAWGGYPVVGEVSDFALYLQMYGDEDALAADTPRASVRVNPRFATEDLHDMFRWALQER